jgi:hypothetical protein
VCRRSRPPWQMRVFALTGKRLRTLPLKLT